MNAVVERIHAFRLSSSAVEALKWIALAAMVVDHVNAAFFAREVVWMGPVGRLAMPIFVLVIGYNMARPGADIDRLLRRLVLVGLIAWIPHAVVFGGMFPLDVLFTFAAAILLVRFVRAGQWVRFVAGCMVSVVLLDYSIVGVWLVAAAWLFFENRTTGRLLNLCLALFALCLWNGNGWALYGVLLFLLATTWTFDVPRVRWAFWIAYPAHLAVLALLVALGV